MKARHGCASAVSSAARTRIPSDMARTSEGVIEAEAGTIAETAGGQRKVLIEQMSRGAGRTATL